MKNAFENINVIQLFGDYMKVTGVPSDNEIPCDIPEFKGKKLGVVNAGSWINLWSVYFGQKLLPGVKIINSGNDAVQLNFIRAHHKGEKVPPDINIEMFLQQAKNLVELMGVDAILISCSTMNRAYQTVKQELAKLNVPVIQIDEAMMEKAVETNGKILVVATHGPTVKSTQALLQETAERMGRSVDFAGATIEEAFEALGEGDIARHNQLIADAIREAQKKEKIDIVVLAQLTMTVFDFSYPDPVKEFGVPVLTSGITGFIKAGEILKQI